MSGTMTFVPSLTLMLERERMVASLGAGTAVWRKNIDEAKIFATRKLVGCYVPSASAGTIG